MVIKTLTPASLAAIVACTLLPVAAVAHHSFAAFDQSRTINLSGTVKSFEWTNPHSWVHLIVNNPDKTTSQWDIECGNPNLNVRLGWKQKDMKPGDKVTISIHPMRDGSKGGTLLSAKLADGRVLVGNGSNAPGGKPATAQ